LIYVKQQLVFVVAEDPPDNLIGQEGIGTDIKLPVSVEVLPTSLKVCLGDTPLISCIGRTFNGTVKVKWSYKGNPVSSLRQNNDRQNLARQLKVRVKSAEDTGDYTCTVTAHSQQAISQATVTLAGIDELHNFLKTIKAIDQLPFQKHA
jgi:hypothetical protein